MKKFLSLILASIVCLCCFGLVACNDPSTPPPADPPATFDGTYKLYSVSMVGSPEIIIGTQTAIDAGFTADAMVLVLNTDGTAILTNSVIDETANGTWVKDDTTITMSVPGGEPQTFTIVDATTVSLTDTEDTTVILKKVQA